MASRTDWKSELRDAYTRGGKWTLSDAMQSFIQQSTSPEVLRQEFAAHQHRGSSYNDDNWRRGEYRQWYLAYYSAKYISSLQRALIEYWPAESFDSEVCVLDVGVGPGTTALALMDLCDVAERLGIARGGLARFAAIDRDPDKIDYAIELSYGFAKQSEAIHGPRRWTRSVVSGSDWFELDLADGDSVGDWAAPRFFDVVVASNTYSELRPQERAAQNLSQVLIPGVLRGNGAAIVLEPAPPKSTPLYKAELLRAMGEISRSLGASGCGPCASSGVPSACSAACDTCRDDYQWEIPDHLRPLYRSSEWNVSTLRGTVRRPRARTSGTK